MKGRWTRLSERTIIIACNVPRFPGGTIMIYSETETNMVSRNAFFKWNALKVKCTELSRSGDWDGKKVKPLRWRFNNLIIVIDSSSKLWSNRCTDHLQMSNVWIGKTAWTRYPWLPQIRTIDSRMFAHLSIYFITFKTFLSKVHHSVKYLEQFECKDV